jgi:glycosyltransferase involved in cell wall biosynthesis
MNQEGTPEPASDRPTLSIVIPIYNELDTWRELLALVESVEMPAVARQIILVDDGSSDGTGEQLKQFADAVAAGEGGAEGIAYKVIFQDPNQGKGAALRTGFDAADGEIVIIQDADMEYDPHDHIPLIQPILDGEADVVYGSRYREKQNRKGYLKNYLANRFLTGLSNLTTGLKLTDMETCYKVFRTSVLRQIDLEQDRFGFEPEITAKIAKQGYDIRELPISYDPRTHEAGKKIGWRDGLKAIWCIFKYGLRRRAKKT